MDLQALKVELLAGHPDTGAYSLDDATAAAELNAVNRTNPRASMTASELMNTINKAEFDALLAGDRALVWNVLHIGDINPFGIEASIFTSAFGAGSGTITSLAAARIAAVSRADELGIGSPTPGDVIQARAV